MVYIYFIIYLITINIIGFLLMCIDKAKAKKGSWRISEKCIFVVALCLGGIGVYMGMYKFRHKTKHMSFTIGIPVCIIINILSTYYLLSSNILNSILNFFI